VQLEGTRPGDVVDATHSSLGEAAVFPSARVSTAGVVVVFMRNEEDVAVDLAEGRLQVVVGQFV
jgi:hypothetical protein